MADIKTGVAIAGQLVPAAVGTLYTPPSGVTRSIIRAASFYAHTSQTLNVHIIPSGGAATDTNKVLQQVIALDATFSATSLIGLSVPTGATLSANDGSGTSISFHGAVTEFSGDS